MGRKQVIIPSTEFKGYCAGSLVCYFHKDKHALSPQCQLLVFKISQVSQTTNISSDQQPLHTLWPFRFFVRGDQGVPRCGEPQKEKGDRTLASISHVYAHEGDVARDIARETTEDLKTPKPEAALRP